MAWIFNLVTLLNFTPTCKCHTWSTISVDGSTSQVACTWMIQMTEWGFPKAKNRASNGTLYDTPPRFAYFQPWNGHNIGTNYLMKLKCELDLYFMVLNKCRKLEENPSTCSRIIIWKPLVDGQTDWRTSDCRSFSEAITSYPTTSKTWTSVTMLKGYPLYVHISLVESWPLIIAHNKLSALGDLT